MADTWFSAKEWKARLVEFAGRRSLRNVANGETTTYDVSRSEGQVSQEGDAFNTKNMNDLEQRVANGFANAKTAVDTLNRDLSGFSFHSNGNGHYLQKGDEMYLLKNKPIEISSWYYQVNGGNSEFIIDSSQYNHLSIGQQNGPGELHVIGKAASDVKLSKGSDGYYDVALYDQIMIRVHSTTYNYGTIHNIRLWQLSKYNT